MMGDVLYNLTRTGHIKYSGELEKYCVNSPGEFKCVKGRKEIKRNCGEPLLPALRKYATIKDEY